MRGSIGRRRDGFALLLRAAGQALLSCPVWVLLSGRRRSLDFLTMFLSCVSCAQRLKSLNGLTWHALVGVGLGLRV